MPALNAYYRNLIKYKYQLTEPYTIQIGLRPMDDIDTSFVKLTKNGELTLIRYYAWDGATFPCPDFRSVMRGALVHDGLYQLMRLGKLDYRVYRKEADDILRTFCLSDGMASWVAWIIYMAVRWFAVGAAKSHEKPEDQIHAIP